MRKILILGAGRSASALIRYFITNATAQQWRITVADRATAGPTKLIGDGSAVATALALDATDPSARAAAIAAHDLVISMLPAFMHMDVVKDCLRLKKHVITPSYVPDELLAMDAEFKAAGLTVLNEMGLDPGIDHMSAMRILDKLRAEGATINSFESYCGGLVAPESDDNPWNYKFSWNPRNVVLAGQGGAAKYIQNGLTKYIPYHRLFQRTLLIPVPDWGDFDGYVNRDSLKYRSHYGLDKIPTLRRGTLRKAGFCAAWDIFVQLGCTDDTYRMELPATASWKQYLNSFLPYAANRDTRTNLAYYSGLDPSGPLMEKLDWLGLFSDEPIGVEGLSPAATLQHLLEQKWLLNPSDKDLVVMWHRFTYTLNGKDHGLVSALGLIGNDTVDTAMARTVGLPIGIASKLVLNGDMSDRGVLLPLKPQLYDPILNELETLGIIFKEQAVKA